MPAVNQYFLKLPSKFNDLKLIYPNKIWHIYDFFCFITSFLLLFILFSSKLIIKLQTLLNFIKKLSSLTLFIFYNLTLHLFALISLYLIFCFHVFYKCLYFSISSFLFAIYLSSNYKYVCWSIISLKLINY